VQNRISRLYPVVLVMLVSLLIAGVSLAAPVAPDGRAIQQAATAPPVSPQPPQPDGSIIHEVRSGDTLFSIAQAYKVDVDTLRKLNNLSPDVPTLKIGQKLIIKPAPAAPTLPPNATIIVVTATFTPGGQQPVPPPSVTAGANVTAAATAASPAPGATQAVTAAPTTVATTAATVPPTTAPTAVPPTPSLTPSPTEIPTTPVPTVVPINSKPILCVSVYEDNNTNHYRDPDEKLVAGIDIAITPKGGTPLKLASMSDAPFCFNDMAAGLATVSTTAPADFGLTSPAALEVELKAGNQIAVEFGIAKGYQPAEITPPPAPTLPPATPATLQTGSMINTVFNYSGIIVLVLAGVVLVGGVIVALLARR